MKRLNDQFRPIKVAPYSLICNWKEVFLNFPSFPFRICSIAQNENPKMPELFNFLKSLNWICQFRSTWNFLGVSGVSLKFFKIPIYSFILVALYRTLYHTCYFYISVKFPGKDFLGQYIFYFYRHSEYFKRPEIQKLWKSGTKNFTLWVNGTYHFVWRRFIIITLSNTIVSTDR